MESLEISAKTVDEAVQIALDQLGLSKEEVEIDVLKKGKPGFLGLGSEEATVRVTPLAQLIPNAGNTKEDVPCLAKNVLERLLVLMGLDANVELKPSPSEDINSDNESIMLEVSGDDLGILIGRRGETLSSLQYILRHIIAHHEKTKVPLTVDVEGYKQRRYKALSDLALSLAQKVRANGRSMTLEPMPADERRIVHLALSSSPDVTTLSVGEGELRKVIIQTKKR